MRRGLALWCVLLGWTPARAQPAAPDGAPLTAFQAAKAARLLREQRPCLGCHQLGAEGGAIGPDLSAVGARLSLAAIRAKLADPQAGVPDSIMPKLAWRPGQLELVARYLAGQRTPAATPRPAPPAIPPVDAARSGPSLYAHYCAPCHGVTGDGRGFNARHLSPPPTAHRDAALMSRRPDDTLFDGIHGGGAILGKSPRMPAFGQTLSAADLRALVAHIRTLCACVGPAWSIDPR